MIVRKAVRNSSQVERLVQICEDLINQKPKFRPHLLKVLQGQKNLKNENIFFEIFLEQHNKRKELKTENRQHFIGLAAFLIEVYLTFRDINGVAYCVLTIPIKKILVEIINDAKLDSKEGKNNIFEDIIWYRRYNMVGGRSSSQCNFLGKIAIILVFVTNT